MKSWEIVKRSPMIISWLAILSTMGCHHEQHQEHEAKGRFLVTNPLRKDQNTKVRAERNVLTLEAAIEGAKVRFRPILMTSFAFIAGLIPLVTATGPGAIGNHTIGASALGGMLFGTVFGVIIVPGLYFIFGTIAEGKALIRDEEDRSWTEEVTHHA